MNMPIIALLMACGGQVPHSHDGDGNHVHNEASDHGDDDKHDRAHHAKEAIEAPLGTHTARLEPTADSLKLVVVDGEGKAVAAGGEAKVMLTGTGEEAQKVILKASGDGWTGAAKAEGASGYLAVVTVSVGGHQESARLVWGDVPEAGPAREAHDHGDEALDHGDHGHQH